MTSPGPYSTGGENRHYYGANDSRAQARSSPSRGVSDDNRSSNYSSRFDTENFKPNSGEYGAYESYLQGIGSAAASYQTEASRPSPSRADQGGSTSPTKAGRRRKMVCVVTADEEVEVTKYYEEPPDMTPYRTTVCMNQHVLARMEDDLRRAELRRANPVSAIPDRGQLFEEEVACCVEARTPVRNRRRSLSTSPRSGTKRTTGAYHLPPLSPQSNASRNRSRSRQSSVCNTPSSQQRGSGGGGRSRSAPRTRRSGDDGGAYRAQSPSSARRQLQLNNDADGAVVEDDGTADFIRREKERDLRRRLMRSQEEDTYRHSQNPSGKKLAYDDVNTTHDSADMEDRAARDAEVRRWRDASLE